MPDQTVHPTLIRRIINALGHPAWNGVTCFFTAIGALLGLGFGGWIVGDFLGLFISHLHDVFIGLTGRLEIPIYVLVIGIIVLLICTLISFKGFARNKSNKQPDATLPDVRKFELSEIDIAIMKQLSVAKELGNSYQNIAEIAKNNKIKKNQADYVLRNLKKHKFVARYGEEVWGIADGGIDYLVENKHI
jgi:hypothetical protein